MKRIWGVFVVVGVLIVLAVLLSLRSQSAEEEEVSTAPEEEEVSMTPEDYYTRISTLRKVDGAYEQAAQEALAFLEVYQEKDMLRQKIYYEYAAAIFQQENFDDAKIVFQGLVDEYAWTALDKTTEDFFVDDAQFFVAVLEEQRGDKDIAFENFKTLVENFPESNRRVNGLMTLGDLSLGKKKWQKSLDYYYQLINEYPESDLAVSARWFANRALIHSDEDADDPETEEVEDNSDEIERNLAFLLENHPDSDITPEAVGDIKNYYHMKACFDDAEKYCELLFEKYPDNRKTKLAILDWVDLVTRIHENAVERRDEVFEWIERMRQEAIDKQDTELYENALFFKGIVFMRTREWDSAIEQFQNVLDTYLGIGIEFEVRLRFMKASCYMGKEEWEMAIEELEKAPAENAPCDWPVVVTYMIGCCYQGLHDVEKTKEYYDRVIAEYPDTTWAKSIEKDRADVEEVLKSRSKTK